jgi:hypothetical protein
VRDRKWSSDASGLLLRVKDAKNWALWVGERDSW